MTEAPTLDLEAHMRDVTERAVRNAFAVYMKSHEPPVKGIVADLTDIAAESAARAIYVALSDRVNGTPCAEIRWQQERDELRAKLAARGNQVAAALQALHKAETERDALKRELRQVKADGEDVAQMLVQRDEDADEQIAALKAENANFRISLQLTEEQLDGMNGADLEARALLVRAGRALQTAWDYLDSIDAPMRINDQMRDALAAITRATQTDATDAETGI